MIEKILSLHDAILRRVAHDSHPGALSDLNMPLGNTHVFSTDTGSIVSVIKIEGCREYVIAENHEEHVMRIAQSLSAFIKAKTTDFAWLHCHLDEEEENIEAVKEAIQPLYAVSEIQGYRNGTFLQETVDVMKGAIQREGTYLCIWSLKSESLPKSTDIPYIKVPGHQSPSGFTHIERLLDSHSAKVKSVLQIIKDASFHARLLSNIEACRMIAENLDPTTLKGFTPRLFGHIEEAAGSHEEGVFTKGVKEKRFFLKGPQNRQKGIKGKDFTAVFPAKVGVQMWNSQPQYHQSHVVVGERAYASIMITYPPDRPTSFEALVKALRSQRVPFRMSMYSKTNPGSMLYSKYSLATLLKRLPGKNALIQAATGQMIDFLKSFRDALTLQMVLTVWAPKDDAQLLRQRVQLALKAINTWQAQGQLMSDDSLYGLVSTLPPYRSKSVAPAVIGPAEEILMLAPLTRPALPWREGGVLFSGTTGKLIPFQPLSDELTHHVYLVCGEPGYGKSLLCQVIMIAIAETFELLPYMAITDVGRSSLGTIRYLQSILPPQRKHLVNYTEMRNEKRMSINRFDTPLGLRRPLHEDFDEICAWLLLGTSDSQDGTNKPGMDALIADAVALVYDRRSDTGPRAEPRRHEESNKQDRFWSSHIQPALDKHGITVSRETTYWELVDALYDLGEYHASALIQRFAVPLLDDLISACNSEDIRSAHRQELSPGFTLADHAYQRLTALRNELEITHLPTQFDLTETRITAFNLEFVVRNKDTIAAKRSGGLFFGVTAALQVEPFFWDADRVNEIDPKYRDFHRAHLEQIARTRNLYFADEQHYFTGIESANRIPDGIAALGRKRGIGVMLATQLPRHFTPLMIELSTVRFYVGFSRSSIDGVVQTMKLNSREHWLLENRIQKPNREGSHMLVQVEAESGVYSQFVNLRVGIRKLWALSTKSVSSIVRDEITREFGYEGGLDLLSRFYPSGEVESEYERLLAQLNDRASSAMGLDELGQDIQITDIAQHIIQRLKERGREALAANNLQDD